MSNEAVLTVYPQRTYHGSAYLVGNRRGLKELQAAIAEALSDERPTNSIYGIGVAVVQPSDQEQYIVAVVCDEMSDHDTAYWDRGPEEPLTIGDGNSLAPEETIVMAVGAYLYHERKTDEQISAE